MGVQKKVDVVTVGGGWTSAILAWKLTAAGHRVVALEQGPSRWANPDFAHNHDALRFHFRRAMMVNLAKETWTWRPNPKAPSLPMRQYGSFNPGEGVGGSGIHWTAQLWRFLPTDFNYKSHTIERYGKSKIPEGALVQDWPVSYADLEPYYDAFEYDIGASGQVGNLNGEIIAGGNPFEGPRSRPYPLPPMPRNIPSMMFEKACNDLGYHPFPYASGISSVAYHSPLGAYRSGCILCGFCTRYGCEVDAKSSPQNTHIPPAMKTGKYEIRTGCKVTGINTRDDGLAKSVTYIDADGIEQEQPADVVVLSAFTFTNVRLLLLHRSKKHPDGMGNQQNLVGKHYTYQQYSTPVSGIFEGRKFNLYMGNGTTQNAIYDFNGDNFDHSNVDFIGGAQIYGVGGERDPNTTLDSWPFSDSKAHPETKSWGKEWKENLRKYWVAFADIGIEAESLPYDDQYLDLDPVYKGADGKPLLRLTFDWHDNDKKLYKFMAEKTAGIMKQMGPTDMDVASELPDYDIHTYQSTHPTGGAIMGTDPGNSVVNQWGQVWSAPNVFVTGACQYPQNPGANPTDTLGALTYRQGDAMRDKYFKHPDRLID
jgi:gluconate 2-dehydrogenase alpha chain